MTICAFQDEVEERNATAAASRYEVRPVVNSKENDLKCGLSKNADRVNMGTIDTTNVLMET